MKLLKIDRRVGLTCILLALVSLVLHARTIGFDFVDFDDTMVLLGHPNLYSENSFTSSLHEIFVGYFPREEPLLLRDVSWALDARLFGFDNPVGYHLGNVLINAANVCLLFLFLLRATRRYNFALVVAGLFALLPIHVEPVSWVMGRKDMLCAFFILAALLAQTTEFSSKDRRPTFYLLGLLFTAMALLSKMGAVSCVAVLGLHRIFHHDLDGTRPAREAFDVRGAFRAVFPKLVPHALLTGGIAIWYGRIVGEFGVTGWRGLGPTDPEHITNVLRFAPLVVGRYFKQIFFISQPSLYYRWPNVGIPLTRFEMVGSALIALALVAVVIFCCLRRRDLAFYLLAFAAFLLPYLNIIYVGIWSADRYVYLSSFCLLAVVVSLMMQLRERSSPPLRAMIVVLMVGFGLSSAVFTLQHQSVWRNSEALWSYEAYRDEPSLLSMKGLAELYMKQAGEESNPARRKALIDASRLEIKRGFAREKALGRVPAPYATSEQLYLGQFYYLLGRLDMIEQEPVTTQIQHFQASYAIAPTRTNTLMLAGVFFDLANGQESVEREKLINRSLDYFLKYVYIAKSDPIRHEQDLALLAQNYEQRFPFLRTRIHQAKESMAQ